MMRDADLAEEMAHRENDRFGNAPLRRAPDPDWIARHLATGEQPVSETMISPKQRDGFTSESPIRAFTEFRVSRTIAIGKGFRPSLAHLHDYLAAMEAKEGWIFAQIILPRDSDGEPTILFRRAPPLDLAPYMMVSPEVERQLQGLPSIGDAINPKHYDGRACADIGERLSANGYQVLKYVWRLGKKDDPIQELGKAIWYAESEVVLLGHYDDTKAAQHSWTRANIIGLEDPDAFLEERIADQPVFTQNIARMLWSGYGQRKAVAIVEAIQEHRFHLQDNNDAEG